MSAISNREPIRFDALPNEFGPRPDEAASGPGASPQSRWETGTVVHTRTGRDAWDLDLGSNGRWLSEDERPSIDFEFQGGIRLSHTNGNSGITRGVELQTPRIVSQPNRLEVSGGSATVFLGGHSDLDAELGLTFQSPVGLLVTFGDEALNGIDRTGGFHDGGPIGWGMTGDAAFGERVRAEDRRPDGSIRSTSVGYQTTIGINSGNGTDRLYGRLEALSTAVSDDGKVSLEALRVIGGLSTWLNGQRIAIEGSASRGLAIDFERRADGRYDPTLTLAGFQVALSPDRETGAIPVGWSEARWNREHAANVAGTGERIVESYDPNAGVLENVWNVGSAFAGEFVSTMWNDGVTLAQRGGSMLIEYALESTSR